MEEKNGGRLNKYRSPYKSDNNIKITVQKKNINIIEDDTNNFVHEITEDKDPNNIYKGFLNNFDFNEKNYIFPLNTKDISSLTESNIYEESTNPSQKNKNSKSIKNLNMKANNVIDIKNIKNINLNTNIHSNNLSPSKANDNNINEQYD